MPNSRNMFYGCYRSNVKPGLINPGLFNWRHHIILWESSPQSKKPGFISPWNFRNWWDDGDVMGFFTSQQLIDVHIYIYKYIWMLFLIRICFGKCLVPWGFNKNILGFSNLCPIPFGKWSKYHPSSRHRTLLVNDAEISPFFPTIPWTTPTFLIQHWTKYQISINIPMIPMVWDVNYRDQVHLGPVPMSRVALLFNV